MRREEGKAVMQGGNVDDATPRGLLGDRLLAGVPAYDAYKVLKDVVLYQKLNEGGMGAVYKGRHLHLDIDVAVKVMVMPPHLRREGQEEYMARFVREAQTAAKIDHPNLVRVFDVDMAYAVNFIVMAYIDGESAEQRLERKGRLTEREAVEICLGAARGLAAAHEKDIVHRDVKPGNIMISKTGEVQVADLGLAKAISRTANDQDGVTQSREVMGTPVYMSPEQFRDFRNVRPAADCWSLGVTLFVLLTGEYPWTSTSTYELADMVRHAPYPSLKKVRPSPSDGICRIVAKALRKDVDKRYPDASKMVTDLQAHLASMSASRAGVLADPKAGSTSRVAICLPLPPPRTLTLIRKSQVASGPTLLARMGPRARLGLALAAVLGTVVLTFLALSAGTPDVKSEDAERQARENDRAFVAALVAADEAEDREDLKELIRQLQAALAIRDDVSVEERLARAKDKLKKALAEPSKAATVPE